MVNEELNPRSWEYTFKNADTFTVYAVFTHRIGGNKIYRIYVFPQDAEMVRDNFIKKGMISWIVPITGNPRENRPVECYNRKGIIEEN